MAFGENVSRDLGVPNTCLNRKKIVKAVLQYEKVSNVFLVFIFSPFKKYFKKRTALSLLELPVIKIIMQKSNIFTDHIRGRGSLATD